jgi:hypothetical protein
LYSSLNIVRVIRARRSRWTRPEKAENVYKILVPVNHFEDVDVGGRILKN